MRNLLIACGATVAAAASLIAATPAEARDGCGRGFQRGYYGRCVPIRGGFVRPGPVRGGHYGPGFYGRGPVVVGRWYDGRGYWDGRRFYQHRYRYNRGWRYR